MRNPTLRRAFRKLRLGVLAGAGDDQDDSPDQCKSTEDWRDRYMFMLSCGGVDRADVQHFFLMSVAKPLIDQRQGAEHYQKDANDCNGFHGIHFFY